MNWMAVNLSKNKKCMAPTLNHLKQRLARVSTEKYGTEKGYEMIEKIELWKGLTSVIKIYAGDEKEEWWIGRERDVLRHLKNTPFDPKHFEEEE